jgi:hypothetical protein
VLRHQRGRRSRVQSTPRRTRRVVWPQWSVLRSESRMQRHYLRPTSDSPLENSENRRRLPQIFGRATDNRSGF